MAKYQEKLYIKEMFSFYYKKNGQGTYTEQDVNTETCTAMSRYNFVTNDPDGLMDLYPVYDGRYIAIKIPGRGDSIYGRKRVTGNHGLFFYVLEINKNISMPNAIPYKDDLLFHHYFSRIKTNPDVIFDTITDFHYSMSVRGNRVYCSDWSTRGEKNVDVGEVLEAFKVFEYNNRYDYTMQGAEFEARNNEYYRVFGLNIGYTQERLVYNQRYQGTVSMEIASVNSRHPPYVLIDFEDAIPRAENISPTSGTINANIQQVFTWKFKTDYTYIPLNQKSATFRWRRKNDTEFTEYEITGNASAYTVPENTFDSSKIEFQIRVQSDDNIWSEEASWYTLSVENPVIHVTGLNPKSSMIDGMTTNTFSWETPYCEDTDQVAYEAEYSTDNGINWIRLDGGTISRHSFSVAAGTFETGTIRWRVRAKNRADVWSAWSEEAVVLIQSELLPPVIESVTNHPRPVVTWTSSGQRAFQIRAGNFDSGEVYGTVLSYRIPEYLPDGNTLIKLRVANVFGFWSEWAVKEILIENNQSTELSIYASEVPNGVRIYWQTDGMFQKYYLLRDGVPIASTADSEIYDFYAGAGMHRYAVRGITQDDYYSDSREITAVIRIKDPIIADVNLMEWLTIRYNRDRSSHSMERQRYVDFRHFDGRRLPVAEVSEFEDAKHTFDFVLVDRADLERLNSLLGRTVILKSGDGDRVIGVLQRNNAAFTRQMDVTFTIQEVDFKERIDYD